MEVLIYLIVYIAMAAASYAIQRHEAKKAGIQAQRINLPIAEQGIALPIIFGTPPRLKTSFLLWWGDPLYHKNHKHGVCYSVSYYFAVHLGLCRSGVDGIKQLWYGDRCVAPLWGNVAVSYDGDTSLMTPSMAIHMFGGETAGGGIYGNFEIQYGAADQEPTAQMTTRMGADIPANRGMVTMTTFAYWGVSPFPREISYIAKATLKNTDDTERWYVAKADIETDGPYPEQEEQYLPGGIAYHKWHVLNPAHMLVQCLTDDTWGEAKSIGDMGDSFTAAADTLYGEGLGLGFAWWPDQMSFADLVQRIEAHADGWLWQNHATGKWEFALNRDDYTIGELESFDESDFTIDEMHPVVDAVVPNRIIVWWTDRITCKRTPAIYDDAAAISRNNGKIVEAEFEREMICDKAVADLVAARLGRQVTAGLTPLKLTCKRTMSHLHRGSVIKIAYDMPDLKITQMVIRVLKIGHGKPGDDAVRIEGIEDIYAAGYSIYGEPPASTWEEPAHEPADVATCVLAEVPFWTLANDIYGAAAAQALGAGAGLLEAVALAPTVDADAYDFSVRRAAGLDFMTQAEVAFTPYAIAGEAIAQAAADLTVSLASERGLALVSIGTYALIGEELVAIVGVDIAASTVTLRRGVLDTAPLAHPAGARLWFLEDRAAIDTYEYTAGDTPAVKFLTKTSLGTLDADDATIRTAAAFASRATRPYPPGNFKVDAVSYPVSFTGDIDLSWSHRDRTDAAQLAMFVEQSSATDYGPEAGTTYTVRVYDQANQLIRTASGLSGKTYTYTEAFERSDCGLSATDPLNTQLRFTVVAVRSGYESYRPQDITVSRWQALDGVVAYENEMVSYENAVVCREYHPTTELVFYEGRPVCYENQMVTVGGGSEWANVVCYENQPVFYENQLVVTE